MIRKTILKLWRSDTKKESKTLLESFLSFNSVFVHFSTMKKQMNTLIRHTTFIRFQNALIEMLPINGFGVKHLLLSFWLQPVLISISGSIMVIQIEILEFSCIFVVIFLFSSLF